MKRSFKIVVATGAAAALMMVGAPAASATEAGDAAGCTMDLIRSLVVSDDPQLVTVTYTPPSTVTVSADGAVGLANGVTNLVVAYVNCVV